MPSSQPNANDLAALRGYLGKTLENSQFVEESVDDHYLPLLILEWTHLRAAFAFSNGSLQASYGALYQGFKRLYAREKGRWDALDRAFVFCVRPDATGLQQFCSSVETDVYFCRKFVVSLIDPIGESLARLPFLPLHPIEGEHQLRPPSAQTLLRSYGVPAPLASVLVVPGQGSAEKIVERCKETQYGQPILQDAKAITRVSLDDQDREPVLIDSIAIENFRAYRKRQVFELGAGVTVLYGPNGFGKTSFFDAIDFALTGGIGRIEGRGSRQLSKLARHLDSGAEESSVAVSFRSGDSSLRSITRAVDHPNQAQLDGRSADRKSVLRILTGATGDGSEHIGNLISLFRATHLFSQEQQELTKNFDNDCLPKETVSRMLAFEDYASATTKVDSVCALLRTSVQAADTEEKERKAQIELIKRELAGYRLAVDKDPDGLGLTKARSDLRSRLAALDVADSESEMTPAHLRRWRGKLDLLVSGAETRIARLTHLQSAVPKLSSIQTQIDASASRAERLEIEVSEARGALEEAERRGRAAADALARHSSARSLKQELVEAIHWCRKAKSRYSELVAGKEQASHEAFRLTAELDKHGPEGDGLAATATALADELKSLASQSESLQRRIVVLQNLAEREPIWRLEKDRLQAVKEAEQNDAQQLDALRSEARALHSRQSELDSELGALVRTLERVDLATTDLRRLLLDVQQHVLSEQCPVCGATHKSKDDLLAKIAAKVEGDPAKAQRDELAGMRERRKALDETLAKNAEAQRQIIDPAREAKEERARLAATIMEFSGAAEGAGIVLTSPVNTPEAEIRSRINVLAAEHQAMADRRTQVARDLDTAQARVTEVKGVIATKKRELGTVRKTLDRLTADIGALQADPAGQLVALNTEVATLDRQERDCLEEIARLDGERGGLEKILGELRAAFSAAKKNLDDRVRDLRDLRASLVLLQTERVEIDAAITAAGMPEAVTATLVAKRVAEEVARRGELASAKDLASAVESAIDTATTAASHDRLRRDIETRERELSLVVSAREENRPWLDYFEDVSKVLTNQQGRAIAAFTTEYGPRASTIQKRLRPVYGFDDVEVRSEDSSIAVRVRRGGDELHPTEYFSQSQVQTLLLSLFLTACVSQTWSSLSPIFLDDPVTHFDDLNTYAFLDLVVGLLEVEGRGRQFVLSTCDEKFLQLARQKFRHLGEAAKFYQFSAIGAEGPVVVQLV